MSMQDPIADMLTRIRNAQAVSKRNVEMSNSKVKRAIAAVLMEEGFIEKWWVNKKEGFHPQLVIELKYYRNKPVIAKIDRISRPGLKVYKPYKKMPIILSGLGIAIVSTPLGIMTAKRAYQRRVGGELLCAVI